MGVSAVGARRSRGQKHGDQEKNKAHRQTPMFAPTGETQRSRVTEWEARTAHRRLCLRNSRVGQQIRAAANIAAFGASQTSASTPVTFGVYFLAGRPWYAFAI